MKIVCFSRRLNDLSNATLTQTLFKGIMFANLKAEVWSSEASNARLSRWSPRLASFWDSSWCFKPGSWMLNQQEPKGESFGKQALTIHKLHKPIVLIHTHSIYFYCFLFLFFLPILELSLPPQHQVGSANHRTCDSRPSDPVRSREIVTASPWPKPLGSRRPPAGRS